MFSLTENLTAYLDDFDEYLNANEFELALERLCDFLSSPTTPGIAPNEIEKIDAAYRLMDIWENRTSDLRAIGYGFHPKKDAAG